MLGKPFKPLGEEAPATTQVTLREAMPKQEPEFETKKLVKIKIAGGNDSWTAVVEQDLIQSSQAGDWVAAYCKPRKNDYTREDWYEYACKILVNWNYVMFAETFTGEVKTRRGTDD